MDDKGTCEWVRSCLFFNNYMKTKPSTAEFMKQKYCYGDKVTCARYMVAMALGRGSVPADLYPNDFKSAVEIIRASGPALPPRRPDKERP